MFKFAKKMEEERQYYEDLLTRSEQKQTASLIVGFAVGAVAGYCAKKYVLPKLAKIEYKERFSEETDFLKERFSDLKHSFLSLKDKLPFGDCCDHLCCCGEDDECDDECCCEESKAEEISSKAVDAVKGAQEAIHDKVKETFNE
ncbi:hypothetical protein [Fusibacter sp. 3D3]|uniref:hypothetical protein n=1 Tax=Fusibacter sp. 3D3 TaxID=1048380 RepID=UPI0008537D57|nr:hypothetical protein [Fusibacter sp. 3D3]GAU76938.1 hypothetical protein F3D3_1537 [Fusibacter sp. 3D3]